MNSAAPIDRATLLQRLQAGQVLEEAKPGTIVFVGGGTPIYADPVDVQDLELRGTIYSWKLMCGRRWAIKRQEGDR